MDSEYIRTRLLQQPTKYAVTSTTPPTNFKSLDLRSHVQHPRPPTTQQSKTPQHTPFTEILLERPETHQPSPYSLHSLYPYRSVYTRAQRTIIRTDDGVSHRRRLCWCRSFRARSASWGRLRGAPRFSAFGVSSVDRVFGSLQECISIRKGRE